MHKLIPHLKPRYFVAGLTVLFLLVFFADALHSTAGAQSITENGWIGAFVNAVRHLANQIADRLDVIR